MNEIKLTIDGKEFTFSLGLGFLGEVIEDKGLSLDDIVPKMINNPIKWVPILMFYSAKYLYDFHDIEVDFSPRSIIDGISKEPGGINCKQTLEFMTALNESLYKNVPADEDIVEDDKNTEKKN